jgi:hypothetical protein
MHADEVEVVAMTGLPTSRRGRVCAEIQNHARSDGGSVAQGARIQRKDDGPRTSVASSSGIRASPACSTAPYAQRMARLKSGVLTGGEELGNEREQGCGDHGSGEARAARERELGKLNHQGMRRPWRQAKGAGARMGATSTGRGWPAAMDELEGAPTGRQGKGRARAGRAQGRSSTASGRQSARSKLVDVSREMGALLGYG